MTPRTLALTRAIWRPGQRAFTRFEIRRFRQHRSTYGERVGGAPLLVLTTIGRRSGRQHSTPLVYLDDEDGWLISGGCGGVPWDPDWVMNLRAEPKATVEIEPSRPFAVQARESTGDERLSAWQKVRVATPLAEKYQRRTARLVPVFLLTPIE